MPDEAFKAMAISGIGLCVVARVMLRRLVGSRVAHGLMTLGGLNVGAAIIIAGIREGFDSDAIWAVGVGVLATSFTYVAFIITGSRLVRISVVVLASITAVAALAMASTKDRDECRTNWPAESSGEAEYGC